MSRLRAVISLLLLLFAFTGATPLVNLDARATPTEVPTSSRRGVAYWDPTLVKYFDKPGSHVTWTYNWVSWTQPTNTWHEYVPILWSVDASHTYRWGDDVAAAAKHDLDSPTHLMGWTWHACSDGASCMTVSNAVAAWLTWVEPQRNLKAKMYLGTPMVVGDAKGLSSLEGFLKACASCTIDFVVVQWQGAATDVKGFKDYIDQVRRIANKRPIWVRDFYAVGKEEEVRLFLDQVMPFMDASDDIHRYSFKVAVPGEGLIDNNGDGLSRIGKYFAFQDTRWK
ncbi:hypothetical protein E8E13_010075 [Curvularia kusanoi]|uniref:Asl1-like glycosyl hydrolase catalytic domain-containing protein n=1 Tax=Curvularia kusanoi TaxID=90978 RepID=A0A9P4THJ9_CURKU|nr:hypothetical protein E8E13_010075 [Curvularia kusanoi]